MKSQNLEANRAQVDMPSAIKIYLAYHAFDNFVAGSKPDNALVISECWRLL